MYLRGNNLYTGETIVGYMLDVYDTGAINNTSAITVNQGASLTVTAGSNLRQLPDSGNITLNGRQIELRRQRKHQRRRTGWGVGSQPRARTRSRPVAVDRVTRPIFRLPAPRPPTRPARRSVSSPRIPRSSSRRIRPFSPTASSAATPSTSIQAPTWILQRFRRRAHTRSSRTRAIRPATSGRLIPMERSTSRLAAARLRRLRRFNSLKLTGSAAVTINSGYSLALNSGGLIGNTTGTISGRRVAHRPKRRTDCQHDPTPDRQ